MKKRLLLFLTLAAAFTMAKAQTPEWSTDIAPILNNKCASCHRSGGIAPFSLIGYAAASSQPGLAVAVQTKKMPPWPPDENYMHFKDERVLSEEEINKIVAWANDGFQEGTESPPPAPIYDDGSELSEIDATFVLPTYTIPADGM